MRTQELDHPLRIIRGQMKDELDALLRANKINYEILDEPGNSDFVFEHLEVGECGKIRLIERPKDRCNFVATYSNIPSEKETLEIIFDKKIPTLDKLDRIILLALYINQSDGKKYFSNEDDNENKVKINIEDFSEDDLNLAYKEIERLRDVFGKRRYKYHRRIVNAIIFSLKNADLWNATAYNPFSKPNKPKIKPGTLADLDEWYEYYHLVKDGGYKISLREIAEDTGFSIGHIRNRHKKYLDNYGD